MIAARKDVLADKLTHTPDALTHTNGLTNTRPTRTNSHDTLTDDHHHAETHTQIYSLDTLTISPPPTGHSKPCAQRNPFTQMASI